jgi:hypothetical protein
MSGNYEGIFGFVNGELNVDVEIFYNIKTNELTLLIDDITLYLIDQDGEVVKEIDDYKLTDDQELDIKDLALRQWERSL